MGSYREGSCQKSNSENKRYLLLLYLHAQIEKFLRDRNVCQSSRHQKGWRQKWCRRSLALMNNEQPAKSSETQTSNHTWLLREIIVALDCFNKTSTLRFLQGRGIMHQQACRRNSRAIQSLIYWVRQMKVQHASDGWRHIWKILGCNFKSLSFSLTVVRNISL